MKFNTQILILVLLLSLSSGVCFAADVFTAQPFAAFALDSKLGTRSLANQSAVTMAASGALEPRKSANEAFLYSLVIPGMGQLYTGAKRGYVYAAAEIGFLTTYFILQNYGENTRDDFFQKVKDHVVITNRSNPFEKWNHEDFEHATDGENWRYIYSEWPETLKRTGEWYWDDLDFSLKDVDRIPEGSRSKHRLEAYELRQKANDTFERAKFFLGLAILNHVVSAVEARITTKRFNARLQNMLTQTRTRTFDIDVQTDSSTGAMIGTLVLRKRF